MQAAPRTQLLLWIVLLLLFLEYLCFVCDFRILKLHASLFYFINVYYHFFGRFLHMTVVIHSILCIYVSVIVYVCVFVCLCVCVRICWCDRKNPVLYLDMQWYLVESHPHFIAEIFYSAHCTYAHTQSYELRTNTLAETVGLWAKKALVPTIFGRLLVQTFSG